MTARRRTVPAVFLNRRKIKTAQGNSFTFSNTMCILKNPAYAGTLRVGHYGRGKFTRVAEDGLIVVENAHEGLVTQDQFDRVQKILQQRSTSKTRIRSGAYLLSTVVVCKHCGTRMYGVRRKQYGTTVVRFYSCNTSPLVQPYDANCPHPSVRCDRLESFVLQTIRERLLKAGAEAKIKKAIEIAKRRDSTTQSKDERVIADLQRKIERGTENLAKADQAKLAVAIRQTIASITIGIHDAKCGKIIYREITGTLEFHPAFGIDPIKIPDEVLGQRRIWREIGELARRSKQPIHLADVCEMIESPDPSHACYHIRRAQAAGLVRKIGHQGGWVAID